MKKNVVVTSLTVMVVCMCCVTMASAQMLNVGVIGGINMANLRAEPDDGIDLKMKFGFAAGGVVELGLSESFGVRLEPMFIQKGARIEESEYGVTIEATFKLNYLEVPVLAKGTFDMDPMQIFLVGGPTLALNLNGEVEAEASYMGQTETETEDISDDIETFDMGITVGGGATIMERFFVESRYTFGLTNIDSTLDGDDFLKTTGFQVFGGMMF